MFAQLAVDLWRIKMNDLEALKKELQEVVNKQIRLETIAEQAKQQCQQIEEKYNISSVEELQSLLDAAEAEYQNKVTEAMTYITETKMALQPFEGLL